MDKQQMRFEAAKAAMQAILGSEFNFTKEVIARLAVDQADALMAELAVKGMK